MNKLMLCFTRRLAAPLFLCAWVTLVSGCASEKSKPMAQRGWIGGEYAQAKPSGFLVTMSSTPGVVGGLPKALQQEHQAAILVTKMNANTPAGLAGLHLGDYVLELNHKPVTRLRDFRRIIDRSKPGTLLAVKAYRHGRMVECNLPVGCEKYHKGGAISFVFPTVVHPWDLWPNPGFSLVFVGYEPNPGVRQNLGKDHEVYDEEWKAYLGFIELSVGKRISAEERPAVSLLSAPLSSVELVTRTENTRD